MKLAERKTLRKKKKNSNVERTCQKSARNTHEITDKPTKKIIKGQLDIKIRQFMEVELRKKNKKSCKPR